MPARLRFVPLLFAAALGCGLHLHRPRDAASAEGADGELKAARLVDGFTEELGQSQAMLKDEVAAAQAWAEVGRDRDLLDVLGARGEADPEVQVLYFTRCRARFKGDGWTTLCSKISTRLHALVGHAFPLGDAPAPVVGKGKPPPVPGPDPGADLLRELRTLQRHWRGPDSGESRLARAVNEHQMAARALKLGDADAAGPGCPAFLRPDASPVLQASVDRQRRLCMDRRDNLAALRERVVCSGPTCGPSELGSQLDQLLAVHDALQQHHTELSRRLSAYAAAKQPCSALEQPSKGKALTPTPRPATRTQPATDQPGTPPSSPAPATPAASTPEPASQPRPASTAARSPASLSAPVTAAMSSGTGPFEPVAAAMSSGTGPFEPVAAVMSSGTGPFAPARLDLSIQTAPPVFLGAGLSAPLRPALAPAPAAPVAAPPEGDPTASTPTPSAAPSPAGTAVPGLTPATTKPAPTAAPVFTPTGREVCDETVLQDRFADLAQVPVPAILTAYDLRPLAELGRWYQLAEQLAAVDALIAARQLEASRKAAADPDPAAAKALAGAPRFARVVHTTIAGIDRLQQAVDTLELAVLALIRETLRVEHDALVAAVGHGERRLRLARAKLVAQLDEAVLLMEAQASLGKLERAGCSAQALMSAYEAGKCRDELTRALVAFGNAWTLGRADQKRADALDLGVRHDASIVRSRAAMALRQVYLAAGVTELVKFTKGGMAPEALAQLIVSTVGFGVLTGAVLAP
ncbi:hypothetical protein [Nannocystis bainbridge]|uniref:Uncharacterized protein n=1 Tax=Nannocystis bainbridge TaxID=2995303 RepID=A0ABT5E4T2_9BACT|nr:hypothetical protein [Nannocystis bainbridge]MDC0719777.1 hypothetical protein [Nannocystis bainbridge]